MNFTEAHWGMLCAAISKLDNVPAWVIELSTWPYEKILELPDYDGKSESKYSIPVFELRRFEQGYLDFLDQQIALEPRGPEWTNVLRRRRECFTNEINRELFSANIFYGLASVWLVVDSASARVVYFESL